MKVEQEKERLRDSVVLCSIFYLGGRLIQFFIVLRAGARCTFNYFNESNRRNRVCLN